MKYMDCFRFLAERRNGELVVTSAGNSGKAWWAVSRDTEATFYLDASMGLSTMFGAGLALSLPDQKIWAFMGDGAFCMNPGTLMVERQLDLPNLTHILVSNRHYGATSNAPLPNQKLNDYVAMAESMGVERAFSFDNLEALRDGYDSVISGGNKGYSFVVLEVEPMTPDEQKSNPQPPFDGPDLKYIFGTHVQNISGRKVLNYRL